MAGFEGLEDELAFLESQGVKFNWTTDIRAWLKAARDPKNMDNQTNYYLHHNLTDSDIMEDKYRRELCTYYLMGIGVTVICCLGIVGNILSLIVLCRPSMRSSTYSYLAALSVCDTLVLIFTLILAVHDLKKPEKGSLDNFVWETGLFPYLFPFVHPAAYTFQVTSIWLTLSFTVDRYIMICHPFKAEPLCTVSRARKVICALCIGAIIFNIPKFLEYKTVPVDYPGENGSYILIGHRHDLTQIGTSSVFRELYHSWFYIIFVCGAPFLTIAILNMFLINAVRLSRKRGREINMVEKKRNDTTIMLIGVIVIFFICQMPALVSRTLWAFDSRPQLTFKEFDLYLLNETSNFLIVLNSSINIVPYYIFGKRFRREFWRLFCRCLQNYEKFAFLTRKFSATMEERNSIGSQTFAMVNKVNKPNKSSPLNCINGGVKRESQVTFLTVQPEQCVIVSPCENGAPVIRKISSGMSSSLGSSNNNELSVLRPAHDDSSTGHSTTDPGQEVESLL